MAVDKDCTCVNDMARQKLADDYAEAIACDFVDTMGGICPAMMDYTVERLVARLLHIAAFQRHREENLDRTLDQVAKHLERLSGTLPATLAVIFKETMVKRGEKNESH